MMKICLFFIFCLCFIGCNSQLADLSPLRGKAKVNISISATNITTETNIFIYMISADQLDGFGRIVASPVNISREMPVGEYKFYGISYIGITLSKCSLATQVVSEKNTSFVLDFQATTCAQAVFMGNSPSLNAGTAAAPLFAESILQVCHSLDGIDAGNDFCTDDLTNPSRVQPRGHITSYDYAILDYDVTNGQVSETGNELSLGCNDGRPFLNQLSGQSQTFVGGHLPAGDGITTPFRMKFNFFLEIQLVQVR